MNLRALPRAAAPLASPLDGGGWTRHAAAVMLWWNAFFRWFEARSAPARGAVIGVLLALVTALDYVTGRELSFLVFYLAPVGLAAWSIGRPGAWVTGAVASFAIEAALAAETGVWDAPRMAWNFVIRATFFGAFAELLRRLRDALRHLEARVEARTIELRREIAERTRLEGELLGVAESEQRRIGRELHDSLGQHLTASALAAQVLSARLGDAPTALDAQRLATMIEDGIELTRGLARGLYPLELETAGLMSALETFATQVGERSGIDCIFRSDTPVPVRDANAAMHLFRIAQEATSNALKHARARLILIELSAHPRGVEGAFLTVTDDGVGLPAEPPAGMGRRLMAHRAQIIGAALTVESPPGGGVVVSCCWPAP